MGVRTEEPSARTTVCINERRAWRRGMCLVCVCACWFWLVGFEGRAVFECVCVCDDVWGRVRRSIFEKRNVSVSL